MWKYSTGTADIDILYTVHTLSTNKNLVYNIPILISQATDCPEKTVW